MLRCGFIPSQRYYIYDEWNDHKLNKGRAHYFTSAGGKMGITGFTPSLKRPEWTILTGATWDPSGEELVVSDAGAVEISTPSTFTVGTWEIDMKLDSLAADNDCRLYFMRIDDDNWYVVATNRSAGDGCRLMKFVAAALTIIIDPVLTTNANYHAFKVTRDGAGNFELFYDDVSQGVVIDVSHTTTNNMILRHDGNTAAQSGRFDNLKVY